MVTAAAGSRAATKASHCGNVHCSYALPAAKRRVSELLLSVTPPPEPAGTLAAARVLNRTVPPLTAATPLTPPDLAVVKVATPAPAPLPETARLPPDQVMAAALLAPPALGPEMVTGPF